MHRDSLQRPEHGQGDLHSVGGDDLINSMKEALHVFSNLCLSQIVTGWRDQLVNECLEGKWIENKNNDEDTSHNNERTGEEKVRVSFMIVGVFRNF